MKSEITKKCAAVFILLGLAACVNLQVFASDAEFLAKAKKLLQLAEKNTEFFETDFSGTYAIVQEKPGGNKSATEAKVFRRDKTSQWTILITNPSKDRGRGYLLQDGTVWFYDPADKRFTFTSARDKFQNTNANTSDFAPQSYYKNYEIESAEDVVLGALKCTLFSLKAKTKNVDYPSLKIWVTDDGLVRKKEDYSLSGQLLRTTAIPSYQTMEYKNRNYAVPAKMLIVDNLRGKRIEGKMQYERTQITITNVSFTKVDDAVYTKPYLEMMAIK